jgi:hypothetical protein
VNPENIFEPIFGEDRGFTLSIVSWEDFHFNNSSSGFRRTSESQRQRVAASDSKDECEDDMDETTGSLTWAHVHPWITIVRSINPGWCQNSVSFPLFVIAPQIVVCLATTTDFVSVRIYHLVVELLLELVQLLRILYEVAPSWVTRGRLVYAPACHTKAGRAKILATNLTSHFSPVDVETKLTYQKNYVACKGMYNAKRLPRR